jgi:PAS domain-containing protein
LLQSSGEVAPNSGDAFLVLDSSLSVCAVSEAAEALLVAQETEAVNRHITELLVPADAEAQGRENLAVAVTWAARGDGATRRVTVRPANTFGVRLSARIASCGPPRAALLVFE